MFWVSQKLEFRMKNTPPFKLSDAEYLYYSPMHATSTESEEIKSLIGLLYLGEAAEAAIE